MERSFHSDSWYRVAELKPRLRRHAKLYRTHYRGQLWYVLQDRTSGRYHRFSPSAYFVISLLDGKHTIQEVWDIACDQLDEDTLTQDEVIRLLGQLHSSDVLVGNIPPDIDELAQRGHDQRTKKMVMSFMNPLALRLPVMDPDAFLTATMPLARPFFSWFGALLFIGTVSYAIALAGTNWSGLTENIVDRVLTATNVALLVVTYCFVKALHELGHGYAVKRWGGDVHEIGLMFLVLMPVPYVDASDAMRFRSKWQRALVGAAGILVEIMLAAIAMIVWVNAEDGIVRAFAFNVMLIGGISTLLFNGNPLLKFDGYYVLSDIAEIPNLAQRANKQIGHIIKRYAFGVEGIEGPATAPGEPVWLATYATLAFLYRLFITAVIVLFISAQFFVIGILLAIWAVTLMLGVPLAKHIWFLFTNPMLRRKRGRAFAVTGGVIAVIAGVLFAVPVPHSTIAEGVVLIQGDQRIHADADGVIVGTPGQANARITSGQAVLQLEDPLIDAREQLLARYIVEIERRLAVERLSNQSAIQILREELRHAQGDLQRTRQRREDLTIRARTDGTLVLTQPSNQLGRFVVKGELIGYVTDFQDPQIRVIVSEARADLVRSQTHSVQVRYASKPEHVMPGEIVREVPALNAELPSMVLATEGGGQIALDPTAATRQQALSKLMHLDLRLPEGTAFSMIGERVYVRFAHPEEPLATQAYRAVRQVFLRHFEL